MPDGRIRATACVYRVTSAQLMERVKSCKWDENGSSVARNIRADRAGVYRLRVYRRCADIGAARSSGDQVRLPAGGFALPVDAIRCREPQRLDSEHHGQ